MVNTILREADLFCPNSVRINFTIYLNGYKSYNYTDVARALGKKFTPSTINLGASKSDHSKIFQVTIGGKVAFLMIGSTNFSRQQYVLPDSYNGSKVTNQEEVAFLNCFAQTSHLFFPGMGEDNTLMSRWLEENMCYVN